MTPAPSSPISREAALRLALAARSLPGIGVADFVRAVGERYGLPLTEQTLGKITVKDIKEILQGNDVVEPDMPSECLKSAARHLWGESAEGENIPQPAADIPDLARALRVAVASNAGEQLDGHFGSCMRFLVYQVAEEGVWLLDVRSTLNTDEAEDRNAARATLIEDCHLVLVQSIGGPAAAKVIRANVHPMKIPEGGAALPALQKLQAMLASPPPWIAKALGEDSKLAARYRAEHLEDEELAS